MATPPIVGIALLVWLQVSCGPFGTSSEERSARDDTANVGEAVARYVAAHDGLPRVRVSGQQLAGGDIGWGEDFMVEGEAIRRADPSRARLFFVVGHPDAWCVEMLYNPPATFSDASPSAWTSMEGSGAEPGEVRDGRCGREHRIEMRPVPEQPPVAPGTIVDAALAPVGACFSDIPFDGRPTLPLTVVDCGDAHLAEIYDAGTTAETTYAGYQESAARLCATAFAEFVGVPHNLSRLAGGPFTQEETDWVDGAGVYSCVLFIGSEDYHLVGTARDSWR